MKKNDVFTEQSLTMVIDVETNQWYSAETFRKADDLEASLEAWAVTDGYLDNENGSFIHMVVDVLKLEEPCHYNGEEVYSMKHVYDAVKEVENFMKYSKQKQALLELDLVDFLFRFKSDYQLTSITAEINLAGFYVLPSSDWLGVTLTELKGKLASLPNYSTPGLECGYHALVNSKDIEAQLEMFYKYHKPYRTVKKNIGTGLIVAHNVTYEWTTLLTKSKLFRKLNKEGLLAKPLRGNCRNSIKSIDVKFGKKKPEHEEFDDRFTVIAVRDSLMYSRSSLAKAGDKYEFPKGEIDYYRTFELEEVKATAEKWASDGEGEEDYVNLLEYNRRDCEIPFCILNETFYADYYDLILAGSDHNGVVYGNVPVSNNQVEDKVQEALSQDYYEVSTGLFRDKKGRTFTKFKNGCHLVKEITKITDHSDKRIQRKDGKGIINAIRAAMLYKNNKNFGYAHSNDGISETITMGYGDSAITETINYNADAQMNARQVSGGGLVGVNPAAAFKIYNKEGKDVVEYSEGKVTARYNDSMICHCDLVSAHPSQVNKRLFPAHDAVPASDKEVKDAIDALNGKCWTKIVDSPKTAFEVVVNFKPKNSWTDYSGYANFVLKNVVIKNVNGNMVPCMPACKSKSKLSGKRDREDILKTINEISDNIAKLRKEAEVAKSFKDMKNFVHKNKVYKAEKIDIACTFEDLSIMQMFYDFEIESAHDMCIYQMKPVDAYVWWQFDLYGAKKNAYKKIDGLAKGCSDIADRSGEDYKNSVNEMLNNLEAVKALFTEADYKYIKKHAYDADLKDYTKDALQRVKGVFNGIYGQLYQSPFHEEAVLVDANGTLIEAEHSETYTPSFKPSAKRNYLTGMYIAQWSRVDIALHLKYCINNGCKVLYWATDSIYYIAPKGLDVRGLFNEQSQKLKDQRPNNNHLGGMDMEQWDKASDISDIDGICTTQCLRIITSYTTRDKACNVKGHKIEATFSGADKDVVFADCSSFMDYANRLTSSNYIISPFDNNKNQKRQNNDGTYNLVPQGFVLNDSNNLDCFMSRFLSRNVEECFN